MPFNTPLWSLNLKHYFFVPHRKSKWPTSWQSVSIPILPSGQSVCLVTATVCGSSVFLPACVQPNPNPATCSRPSMFCSRWGALRWKCSMRCVDNINFVIYFIIIILAAFIQLLMTISCRDLDLFLIVSCNSLYCYTIKYRQLKYL